MIFTIVVLCSVSTKTDVQNDWKKYLIVSIFALDFKYKTLRGIISRWTFVQLVFHWNLKTRTKSNHNMEISPWWSAAVLFVNSSPVSDDVLVEMEKQT